MARIPIPPTRYAPPNSQGRNPPATAQRKAPLAPIPPTRYGPAPSHAIQKMEEDEMARKRRLFEERSKKRAAEAKDKAKKITSGELKATGPVYKDYENCIHYALDELLKTAGFPHTILQHRGIWAGYSKRIMAWITQGGGGEFKVQIDTSSIYLKFTKVRTGTPLAERSAVVGFYKPPGFNFREEYLKISATHQANLAEVQKEADRLQSYLHESNSEDDVEERATLAKINKDIAAMKKSMPDYKEWKNRVKVDEAHYFFHDIGDRYTGVPSVKFTSITPAAVAHGPAEGKKALFSQVRDRESDVELPGKVMGTLSISRIEG